MNKNIDLTEILKNCKEGTKLYCTLLGEVEFVCIEDDCEVIQIVVRDKYTDEYKFTKEGKYYNTEDGECLLFPSKDQRDWSKFKVKKPKFDPKTLQPFDKILVRNKNSHIWFNDFYAFSNETGTAIVGNCYFDVIIPYNEETKYLIGTTEEAPEYYRYWEE